MEDETERNPYRNAFLDVKVLQTSANDLVQIALTDTFAANE